MKKNFLTLCIIIAVFILSSDAINGSGKERITLNFDSGWKFYLGNLPNAQEPSFNDMSWRYLDLPHDWSIEGQFSEKNPAGYNGGALPGGIGWYRKTFTLPEKEKTKSVFIDFDGVYRNSEVWINGRYLGKRPYGYSSFRYELTPYLNFGDKQNLIAVKVDNSAQPNSRWYSGSGIYRNVWLVLTNKVSVDHWGTCVTTPDVNEGSAKITVKTKIGNRSGKDQTATIITTILNPAGHEVARSSAKEILAINSSGEVSQNLIVKYPSLWSLEKPVLYSAVSKIELGGKICDEYETRFGIRYFEFNSGKGFLLNGKPVKINGVCDHHDLGPLGAAVNTRAIERQLELLKGMGCNGIRTSHNPPAPELLDLCDKIGFVVMDEAFDMWKIEKTDFDYHLDWDKWHKTDLEDMILRDRNHPSVFIWSIGNEIPEQEKADGTPIAKELGSIVRSLDNTRPITSALNGAKQGNYILDSGTLDLIGYNYKQNLFPDFPKDFPEKKFIATETTSAIATRGSYDLPSDSIRVWPTAWDGSFKGNPDYTCSAYDNCRVPWGSTHEETWKIMKKYDFLSGFFIWTGFDYLGEPTPYPWPARSSYFGILDLCGFPKDAYYMYQSEWTNKPVLHILPHWNWKENQPVDVWTYTSGDAVELFLNGKSLGLKKKSGDDIHLSWRVPFSPGTLKAVAYLNGKKILENEVRTAGEPERIVLHADRNAIHADGRDLSFVTVTIVDKNGVTVPRADNQINFHINGAGFLAAVDNGDPVSHESFKGNSHKALNGLCLAVIKAGTKPGKIHLTASAAGLKEASLIIDTK
jgi:beta-galactosidase